MSNFLIQSKADLDLRQADLLDDLIFYIFPRVYLDTMMPFKIPPGLPFLLLFLCARRVGLEFILDALVKAPVVKEGLLLLLEIVDFLVVLSCLGCADISQPLRFLVGLRYRLDQILINRFFDNAETLGDDREF